MRPINTAAITLLAFVLFCCAIMDFAVLPRLERQHPQSQTLPHFVPRPPVTCKVCHCGKEACVAACSEENMCAMRCEQLCQKPQVKHMAWQDTFFPGVQLLPNAQADVDVIMTLPNGENVVERDPLCTI